MGNIYLLLTQYFTEQRTVPLAAIPTLKRQTIKNRTQSEGGPKFKYHTQQFHARRCIRTHKSRTSVSKNRVKQEQTVEVREKRRSAKSQKFTKRHSPQNSTRRDAVASKLPSYREPRQQKYIRKGNMYWSFRFTTARRNFHGSTGKIQRGFLSASNQPHRYDNHRLCSCC